MNYDITPPPQGAVATIRRVAGTIVNDLVWKYHFSALVLLAAGFVAALLFFSSPPEFSDLIPVSGEVVKTEVTEYHGKGGPDAYWNATLRSGDRLIRFTYDSENRSRLFAGAAEGLQAQFPGSVQPGLRDKIAVGDRLTIWIARDSNKEAQNVWQIARGQEVLLPFSSRRQDDDSFRQVGSVAILVAGLGLAWLLGPRASTWRRRPRKSGQPVPVQRYRSFREAKRRHRN